MDSVKLFLALITFLKFAVSYNFLSWTTDRYFYEISYACRLTSATKRYPMINKCTMSVSVNTWPKQYYFVETKDDEIGLLE